MNILLIQRTHRKSSYSSPTATNEIIQEWTKKFSIWKTMNLSPNKDGSTNTKTREKKKNFTCHVSCVTCHVSRVTCNMSPVTNTNSHRPSPIIQSRLVYSWLVHSRLAPKTRQIEKYKKNLEKLNKKKKKKSLPIVVIYPGGHCDL